jgi:hypothetical protein
MSPNISQRGCQYIMCDALVNVVTKIVSDISTKYNYDRISWSFVGSGLSIGRRKVRRKHLDSTL